MDRELVFYLEAMFWSKNVLMVDFFIIINMQLFMSQYVNWWTGVVWFTCGLLWCFYQLFGLSFWWHPFTAEDPLVSKWWNATFLQICSDREANSSILNVGLGDISHVIIMCISSVKPVPWLVVNLHHLLLNGAAINTQSQRPLTSYVISCSLSKAIHLR